MPRKVTETSEELAKELAQLIIEHEHAIHAEEDRARLEKEFAKLDSETLERVIIQINGGLVQSSR